ncbi:hypothetical protein BD289DRAFT_430459 [Coniella lustricola]|uniref:Secreted protein n=1 Tax=Coniella lustricola TaxID=2025994 RepID=A0A2T3AC26_9PEZI|nr:hypothetical protein BD289DRAFT_430459 [Coniella lustricola]
MLGCLFILHAAPVSAGRVKKGPQTYVQRATLHAGVTHSIILKSRYLLEPALRLILGLVSPSFQCIMASNSHDIL